MLGTGISKCRLGPHAQVVLMQQYSARKGKHCETKLGLTQSPGTLRHRCLQLRNETHARTGALRVVTHSHCLAVRCGDVQATSGQPGQTPTCNIVFRKQPTCSDATRVDVSCAQYKEGLKDAPTAFHCLSQGGENVEMESQSAHLCTTLESRNKAEPARF
jgi:hypothetical protein